MASQSSTFSGAAKRLGISQPSLSNIIAKIESMLGMRLFDRTTRTMVLTQEGERLAVVADELVRNFQASLENIKGAASDSRGRLSIAVIPSVAAAIGPRVLNLFFESHPGFDVAFHDVAGEKALAWVLDRVVDFAIMAAPSSTADILLEPLFRDEFRVFCRNDHPFANKRSVSWTDVASAQVILAGTGAIQRDIENAWLRDEVEIKPRFKTEQLMTGLAMVAGGLGVAILPGLCSSGELHPSLVSVPMGKAKIMRDINVVRRTDRALSRPAQNLLDCFRRVLAG